MALSLFAGGGGANAATTVDVGGYVPTSDSPVVGGYKYGTYICTRSHTTGCSMAGCTTVCDAGYYPLATGSFGILGLTGSQYACADNSVSMQITNYIRPDTGTAFTGNLCVKTDTYQ